MVRILVYFSILLIQRTIGPQCSNMTTQNEIEYFCSILIQNYDRKTFFIFNKVCKPATSERLVGKSFQI